MERRTLLSVTASAVAIAVTGCLHDEEETTAQSESNESTTDDGGTDNDTTAQPEGDSESTSDQDEEDDESTSDQDEGDGEETDENGEDVAGEEESIFEGSFRGESQDGFITISEAAESKEQAREAGFRFPEDDPIVIEAEIEEDGRWESTTVEFPELQTEDGIEATVELPDGLAGELTPQRMTAEGRIQIRIDLLDAEFGFDIASTSERSNALRGETALEERPKTATLVDNEFVIEEETGQPVVDGRLELPATEPGTNWFELEILFDENNE